MPFLGRKPIAETHGHPFGANSIVFGAKRPPQSTSDSPTTSTASEETPAPEK